MDPQLKPKLKAIKKELAMIGWPIESAIEIGKYCEFILNNPGAYNEIKNIAVQKGVLPREFKDLPLNFEIMAKFMVIGKSAELIKKYKI